MRQRIGELGPADRAACGLASRPSFQAASAAPSAAALTADRVWDHGAAGSFNGDDAPGLFVLEDVMVSAEELESLAQELRAQGPKRADYTDEDAFLEATARFAERQGRTIAMLETQARQLRSTSRE